MRGGEGGSLSVARVRSSPHTPFTLTPCPGCRPGLPPPGHRLVRPLPGGGRPVGPAGHVPPAGQAAQGRHRGRGCVKREKERIGGEGFSPRVPHWREWSRSVCGAGARAQRASERERAKRRRAAGCRSTISSPIPSSLCPPFPFPRSRRPVHRQVPGGRGPHPHRPGSPGRAGRQGKRENRKRGGAGRARRPPHPQPLTPPFFFPSPSPLRSPPGGTRTATPTRPASTSFSGRTPTSKTCLASWASTTACSGRSIP